MCSRFLDQRTLSRILQCWNGNLWIGSNNLPGFWFLEHSWCLKLEVYYLGFLFITFYCLTSPPLWTRHGTAASGNECHNHGLDDIGFIWNFVAFVFILFLNLAVLQLLNHVFLFSEQLTCLVLLFREKSLLFFIVPGMKLQQKVCTKKRALKKIRFVIQKWFTATFPDDCLCQHLKASKLQSPDSHNIKKALTLRRRLLVLSKGMMDYSIQQVSYCFSSNKTCMTGSSVKYFLS